MSGSSHVKNIESIIKRVIFIKIIGHHVVYFIYDAFIEDISKSCIVIIVYFMMNISVCHKRRIRGSEQRLLRDWIVRCDDRVSVTGDGVQPSFNICVVGLVQPYAGSLLLAC
jgi:hypothetical protein